MFDPSRLYSALLNTGLQVKDNALYQVIYQLINALAKLSILVGSFGSSANGNVVNNITQQLGGPAFDGMDGIDGLTIIQPSSSSGSSFSAASGYWTPLTDGDLVETDLIFASGESIAVFVPTP